MERNGTVEFNWSNYAMRMYEYITMNTTFMYNYNAPIFKKEKNQPLQKEKSLKRPVGEKPETGSSVVQSLYLKPLFLKPQELCQ